MPKPACWTLCLAARLLLAAALAAVIASAVLRVFDFSHPGDYGEGPVLGMVERIRGEPVSAAWLDGPPYTLSCYGPGYYRVVAWAAALLPWDDTLLPGRLVSLLATLVTAALVGLAVGRSTRSLEAALAAALVFLVSPIARAWGTPHRVDALATALAVGAYVAVKAPRAGAVASAACIVAGSLVKQTVVLAAVPIFCHLLLTQRYKAAAGYALAVAVPGAAAWLALDAHSGGYYLATAIRGNVGALFPGQGFWAGHAFLCTPLGAVAGLLVAILAVRRPAAALGSLWCVGFALSTAAAAALSAKEGAAANYFLEASALGAVVVGCHGLGPLCKRQPRRTLVLIALAALVLAAPEVRFMRTRGLRLDREPFGAALVAERLGDAPGSSVLADGQLVPAVLHTGLAPLVNDPFVYRLLVEQGRIDPGPLVEAVDRGDVAALVLKQSLETHREHVGRVSQKWPAAVLDAMHKRYRLEASAGQVFLYRPAAE